MIRFFKILVIAASVGATCGCAIHPLPENTAGINTFNIAQKIRCEARDAVVSYALKRKYREMGRVGFETALNFRIDGIIKDQDKESTDIKASMDLFYGAKECKNDKKDCVSFADLEKNFINSYISIAGGDTTKNIDKFIERGKDLAKRIKYVNLKSEKLSALIVAHLRDDISEEERRELDEPTIATAARRWDTVDLPLRNWPNSWLNLPDQATGDDLEINMRN